MSPTNHRHERVVKEIATSNAMLAGELKDPRLEGTVVVSEVRVAAGHEACRGVFVSMRGSSKEQTDAIKALEHARVTFAVRSSNGSVAALAELHFTLDLSQETWNASSSSSEI